MFFNLKPPHCPRTSWLYRPPDDTQPIPPFYGTKRYSASGFLFLSNSLLQETFFKSHSDVHKKDRRLSLSFSTVRKPRRPELGGKKRRACPLSRRVATVFGAVKILRLPLVKVTEQQEGSCGLIPNTGRSLISPPFRPSVRPLLCFALTACLPRRWLALPLCRPPSAVKLAAALLPETPGGGDCPPADSQLGGRRRAGFWEAGSKLAG